MWLCLLPRVLDLAYWYINLVKTCIYMVGMNNHRRPICYHFSPSFSECAVHRCSLAVEAQWNGHYYTTTEGRKGRWGSCIVCKLNQGIYEWMWNYNSLKHGGVWCRGAASVVFGSPSTIGIYVHLIVFCAKHGLFLLTDTTGVICALFGPLHWGHLDKGW